ncbi:hypothetical protein BLAT2472_30612 [Burkholderia latens]
MNRNESRLKVRRNYHPRHSNNTHA